MVLPAALSIRKRGASSTVYSIYCSGSKRHDMGPPHEPSHTLSTAHMPKLLIFLALNAALGAGLGVLTASLVVMSNIAGLHDLIVAAREPFVPLLMLYVFNALTFASLAMGIAVMTLPFDGQSDMRDWDEPPQV